jgi:hypothetical protein
MVSTLSDAELLANTRGLIGRSNQVFAALLAHLGEVEARGLHRTRACSSLYAYCLYELRLSEDEAVRRVAAARLVRRFPELLDAIAAGELHLTGLLMLGPHLTPENFRDVMARAKHRTKKELAKLVRLLDPLPSVPARIEALGPPLPGAAPSNPTWTAASTTGSRRSICARYGPWSRRSRSAATVHRKGSRRCRRSRSRSRSRPLVPRVTFRLESVVPSSSETVRGAPTSMPRVSVAVKPITSSCTTSSPSRTAAHTPRRTSRCAAPPITPTPPRSTSAPSTSPPSATRALTNPPRAQPAQRTPAPANHRLWRSGWRVVSPCFRPRAPSAAVDA